MLMVKISTKHTVLQLKSDLTHYKTMEQKIMTPPPVLVSPMDDEGLSNLFASPSADEYFGAAFRLKCDALAAVLRGESLAAVARKHGITRAAASHQARRAIRIFGKSNLPS
jgi:hypothetical protein